MAEFLRYFDDQLVRALPDWEQGSFGLWGLLISTPVFWSAAQAGPHARMRPKSLKRCFSGVCTMARTSVGSLLLLVAIVSSSPDADVHSVVPESLEVDGAPQFTALQIMRQHPHLEGHELLSSLAQAGNDKTACANVANEAIDSVTKAVEGRLQKLKDATADLTTKLEKCKADAAEARAKLQQKVDDIKQARRWILKSSSVAAESCKCR